ncbi:MAG: ATP-binding protein [Oscillatoria sp. PMC 1068.18]|nr:ATP-binding protein [Oscillatoria sp. PMC 1076.18]MEC4988658.1 ATP-binding protein [Oscillatoria sp. PMC 1068.18]
MLIKSIPKQKQSFRLLLNRQPRQKFQLQVQTQIRELNRVLSWFEDNTAPLIDGKCLWQCKLALTEGFTNAVLHAHADLPPTTEIDLEITILSKYLEIRVYDSGKPFNLKAQLHVQRLDQSEPLTKEGGRGLIFMHEVMDKVKYLRMPNQRNCLVLRKNLR